MDIDDLREEVWLSYTEDEEEDKGGLFGGLLN
jgi:hypothetical protein